MKIFVWTALMTIVMVLPIATTLAQDEASSISGTIYRDVNENGVCVNEAEPRIAANIPLELVSDDVGQLIRVTSGADGTYTRQTDAFGMWNVTVVPGQAWRVTSQQTVEVTLTSDAPDAENVDFCIIEVQTTNGGTGTTLPESGVAVAPPLLFAAALGFLFIFLGSMILLVAKTRGP